MGLAKHPINSPFSRTKPILKPTKGMEKHCASFLFSPSGLQDDSADKQKIKGEISEKLVGKHGGIELLQALTLRLGEEAE